METKGYIHNYTGNGKGKTTAAFGLAIRAIGAGLKVFIGQFIKTNNYSEHSILEKYLPNITIKTFGRGCFIYGSPEEIDIKLANDGLNIVETIIEKGNFDLIVLDEINIALYYKLIDKNRLITLLKNKPIDLEIVLTGRYADKDILNLSDLVTEMKEIKHYYKNGVLARKGIEK
jgi:cob(I)alamin adenosyltransferase